MPLKHCNIKVANVIEDGRIAGPQVRMIRVAVALENRVESIIVMPLKESDRFQKLCEENGVQYVLTPMSRMARGLANLTKYLVSFPYEVFLLRRLFIDEQVDLVHASGGSWQIKGVIAARLAGIPSIWHLNDTCMPWQIRVLFRRLECLANGFIFASYRSREYYGQSIVSRPNSVIQSTVDTDYFDIKKAGNIKDEWFDKRPGPVVGTIANINPSKDLLTLIEAFSEIKKKYTDALLVIVGNEYASQLAYKAMLVSRTRILDIADSVYWAGPRDDVRPLLAQFDVYACTSLAESSPMAVWEAMAMSRAIVSIDVGDVSRYLVDGHNGFVVPMQDSQQLVCRIISLLENDELRRKMGALARKASFVFNPEIIARATRDIYEETILNAKVMA